MQDDDTRFRQHKMQLLSAKFLSAKFLSAKFLSAKFLSAKFLSAKFLSAKFLSAKFLSAKFLSAKFLSAKFLSAKFLSARFLSGRVPFLLSQRGYLTEGFLCFKFEGLIFGGADTWRGVFSEFYGMFSNLQSYKT